MRCYCDSKQSYAACCQSIIENLSAANPEQLMRSRFSAYVIKNYDYILASYAPEQRRNLTKQALIESAQGTQWLSLSVLHSVHGERTGEVEFIAKYKHGEAFYAMHELSHFCKIDRQWFYTTGKMKEKTGVLHVDRNETCPCGSGKKFKKCCRLAS